MTTEEPAKWKRFEQKAFEIQKSLSPENADVIFNDSIPGADSKTNRQIDISIRAIFGSYPILIIVECKDYKTPVDVTAVEAFISVMRDVRASRGVMISAKGFTESAKTLAAHHEVDLRQLIDTESVEWGADVSIPILLERTYIEAYSLMFRNFMEIPIQPKKQMALEVATESGEKLGTIESILHRKWENHEIPHSPGTHRVLIGANLHNEFGGVKQTMGVEAGVVVKRAFYSGPIPIHFEGFLNVKTGGIISRQLQTGTISPYEIETGKVPNWTQVSDPCKLSPLPVLSLGYSDVYSGDSTWIEGTNSVWPSQHASS
ncbi:MAG: restriction endonuclease [Candidatus Acidiferrales bacterium]